MVATLSAVLQRYPLFAGRLTVNGDGDYAVALTGAGASLTVATCTSSLQDLLPQGAVVPMEASPAPGPAAGLIQLKDLSALRPAAAPYLTKEYSNRPGVALFHVQVTSLRGGGSALGLVVPHVVADLRTVRLVVNACATEYTRALGAPESPPPPETTAPAPDVEEGMVSTEISARIQGSLPPKWTSACFERRGWTFFGALLATSLWHTAASGRPQTVAYHVPAARLAVLKAEASKTLPPGEWVSTNDALGARLLQALARLPVGATKTRLLLMVDLRQRVDPPLPPYALGNGSWLCQAADAAAAGDNLGTLALAIRRSVAAVGGSGDGSAVVNELRWLRDATAASLGGASAPCVFKNVRRILAPSGPLWLTHWDWGGPGYGDVAFGSGPESTPVWHQPPFSPTPFLGRTVPAPPALPGGGVLVLLSLHRTLAERLRKDVPEL